MPPKKKYKITHTPHSGAATIRPSMQASCSWSGRWTMDDGTTSYRLSSIVYRLSGISIGIRAILAGRAIGVQLVDAPHPEREQRRQTHRERAAGAEQRRGQHRPRGQLRIARQAVSLRRVHQQIEGVQAAEDLVVG